MKELVAILVIVSNLLFGNSATQCFEDNPQCWDSRIMGNREQGEFDPWQRDCGANRAGVKTGYCLIKYASIDVHAI